MVLVFVLAAVGGIEAWKGRMGRQYFPLLVAGLWVAGGFAAVVFFRSGPDNVPTAFLGLGLLAAAGVANLSGFLFHVGGVLLSVVFVLGPGTQLFPSLGFGGSVTGWSNRNEPLNWLVPRSDGIRILDLVEAATLACPTGRGPRPFGDDGVGPPCLVLLDRGLVHPSWEATGQLGFFLSGFQGVDFRGPGNPLPPVVDVVVRIECSGKVPAVEGRFPGFAPLISSHQQGKSSMARLAGNGCTQDWYGLGQSHGLRDDFDR